MKTKKPISNTDEYVFGQAPAAGSKRKAKAHNAENAAERAAEHAAVMRDAPTTIPAVVISRKQIFDNLIAAAYDMLVGIERERDPGLAFGPLTAAHHIYDVGGVIQAFKDGFTAIMLGKEKFDQIDRLESQEPHYVVIVTTEEEAVDADIIVSRNDISF